MGNLIKIKKGDPGYDKAFKRGGAFAMFIFAPLAEFVCHDIVAALCALGCGIAMLLV